MAVTAGVIDVTCAPAVGTGFDMPTEGRAAAGHNGTPDLGRAAWQSMGGEIGRTEGGQHLGQAGPIHARRSVRDEQFER